ncbi:MAG: pyridoxamine 5'-phosphate oxidase family protein [Acidobacteria bacterium]|nr:MAG: pyridoxamine 5'-phosphate oxidase family protein [Acidobacteriota bacterium]
MSAPDFTRTGRTTVRRLPQRGVYDRGAVFAILDEALVCHVGFARDGQPFVIPTIFARVEDRLYLHGSAASRMLEALAEGIDVCVTVTLVDGLVLARSAFHHSMNYRSVVVLGRARLVTDPEEKRAALVAVVEHVVPGRSRDVRDPSELELLATSVLRLDLLEVSAKVRTGPPVDDPEDMDRPCWAGEIPLRLVAQAPVADPQLRVGVEPPPIALNYERRRR